MVKIVLLNGPPRTGKDTLARNLENVCKDRGIPVVVMAHAHALKESTHERYGAVDENGNVMAYDAFEDVKDTPLSIFGGKTPREAYIEHSEVAIKPRYGHTYWAEILYTDIKSLDPNTLVIITDLGFYEEISFYEDNFPMDDILTIQLHRKGFTFDKDSREYVSSKVSRWVTLVDGDEAAFAREALVMLQLHFMLPMDRIHAA